MVYGLFFLYGECRCVFIRLQHVRYLSDRMFLNIPMDTCEWTFQAGTCKCGTAIYFDILLLVIPRADPSRDTCRRG